jgi:hypothetical protein
MQQKWVISKHYPGICLERQRKITKTTRQPISDPRSKAGTSEIRSRSDTFGGRKKLKVTKD